MHNFQYYLNRTMPHGFDNGDFWTFISIFLSVILVVVAVSLILGLISYIFNAIGLYTMAKKRNLAYPWLAALPIANNYILGHLINDEVTVGSLRIPYAKIFLTLLSFAAAIIMATLGMIPYLGNLLIILVSLAVAFYYFAALFQLFSIYDPNHRIVFLVLSILVPFLGSIFIFAIRHKEAFDERTTLDKPPVDSKAVIGLSLGIISILGVLPLMGSSLFTGVIGLIFSMISLKELKAQGKNHGMALAGLICSIVGLVLTVLLFFACITLIGLGGLGFFNQMFLY